MKACAFCLERFTPTRADQKYCSDICRLRAWKANHPRKESKLCAHCGEPVSANRKFCSAKCRFVFSARQIKHCAECGLPLPGKVSAAKFCSDACRRRRWDKEHPPTAQFNGVPNMPWKRVFANTSPKTAATCT
jgi:predicted nucleic acid-binding Zn ribbon protein